MPCKSCHCTSTAAWAMSTEPGISSSNGAGEGKPVDKRADIWAFGCLLYEMLPGSKTFDVNRSASGR